VYCYIASEFGWRVFLISFHTFTPCFCVSFFFTCTIGDLTSHDPRRSCPSLAALSASLDGRSGAIGSSVVHGLSEGSLPLLPFRWQADRERDA